MLYCFQHQQQQKQCYMYNTSRTIVIVLALHSYFVSTIFSWTTIVPYSTGCRRHTGTSGYSRTCTGSNSIVTSINTNTQRSKYSILKEQEPQQHIYETATTTTTTTTTTTSTKRRSRRRTKRVSQSSLSSSSTKLFLSSTTPSFFDNDRIIAFPPSTNDENVDDETLLTTVASTATASTEITTTSLSSLNTVPLVQLAIAGSITTFFADICMHPIDTIKTVLQNNNGIDNMSLVDAFNHIITNGGIASLYSGFLTYAITDAIGGAFKFTLWESWKSSIIPIIISTIKSKSSNVNNNDNDNDSNKIFITNNIQQHNKQDDAVVLNTILLWIGAGLAFVASSIVLIPGELIKQQLQVGHYTTLIDAIYGIYNSHHSSLVSSSSTPSSALSTLSSTLDVSSITNFYTGYNGVFYRDVPYTIIELSLYEILSKKYFTKDNSNNNASKNDVQQQEEEVLSKTSLSVIDLSTTNPTEEATSSTVSTSTNNNNNVWYNDILAAAITGGIASFCTTPFDTIKTKMMLNDDETSISNVCTTFSNCFTHTVDTYGYDALFAGVTARMGWIVPFTILYLPTYDHLRRQLEQYHNSSSRPTTTTSTSTSASGKRIE